MRTLDIGDIIIAKKEPIDVWAVLGSCIAVIFYAKDKVAMLCHSQLSSQEDTGYTCHEKCPNPCFNDLENSNKSKFVKCTLEYMIDYLRNMDIDLSKLNTTLLGGASLIGKIEGKETVGEKNVRIAKEILKKEGIPINREMVGGDTGYVLWYNTRTDKLFIKLQKDKGERSELLNNR